MSGFNAEEHTADERFMREALRQARMAARLGEVPVGAIVVRNGVVVARGYNRRETDKNALRHAEITAINRACKKLGGWRLWDCTLYVTLEPCPMCAGAIVNARVRRVVFGAYDPKAGCFGSVADFNSIGFNHKPRVEGGLLEGDCAELLSVFFRGLRSSATNNKETR